MRPGILWRASVVFALVDLGLLFLLSRRVTPAVFRRLSETHCAGPREADLTFLELADRLSRGQPTTGIAGTMFREGGKTYLLYTVAGESGIAIAELR